MAENTHFAELTRAVAAKDIQLATELVEGFVRRYDGMLDALEGMEWLGGWAEHDDEKLCPQCRQLDWIGHSLRCRLAAAIADAKGEKAKA